MHRHHWPKVTRDTVLFTVGLAGVVHELYRSGADRPSLLVLLGGMMGLPAVLRFDEHRRSTTDRNRR